MLLGGPISFPGCPILTIDIHKLLINGVPTIVPGVGVVMPVVEWVTAKVRTRGVFPVAQAGTAGIGFHANPATDGGPLTVDMGIMTGTFRIRSETALIAAGYQLAKSCSDAKTSFKLINDNATHVVKAAAGVEMGMIVDVEAHGMPSIDMYQMLANMLVGGLRNWGLSKLKDLHILQLLAKSKLPPSLLGSSGPAVLAQLSTFILRQLESKFLLGPAKKWIRTEIHERTDGTAAEVVLDYLGVAAAVASAANLAPAAATGEAAAAVIPISAATSGQATASIGWGLLGVEAESVTALVAHSRLQRRQH